MPKDELDFKSLSAGDRFLYRKSFASSIMEGLVVELAPSGEYIKLRGGWISMHDLVAHHVLIEVLGEVGEVDMRPNCVTSSKRNGPHVQKPCVGAPSGSPELEAYMKRLGLL